MDDENKLKSICKCRSENIKFEQYYIFLFEGEYEKECDKFFIKSMNHEMDLQKVGKCTLSAFDEEHKYKK